MGFPRAGASNEGVVEKNNPFSKRQYLENGSSYY